MQRTPNYNLLQYQTGDKFLTADLNDSFSKIDTGLSDLQETVNNASGDATVTTNEVIAARKGQASLVDKITALEGADNTLDTNKADKTTIGTMASIPETNLVQAILNDRSYLADSPKAGYTNTAITTWQKRFENNFVDVTDLGADPTGTNDSTTAVNNAITAAVANGSKKVYFPSGYFKITSPIDMVNGLEIIGSNRTTIYDYQTDYCFRIIGGSTFATNAKKYCKIKNITFENKGSSLGAIKLKNVYCSIIDNIQILSSGYLNTSIIYIEDFFNLEIKNIHINNAVGCTGIYSNTVTGNSGQINFYNCLLQQCAIGMKIEGTGNLTDGVSIIGCGFGTNSSKGLQIGKNINNVFATANHFEHHEGTNNGDTAIDMVLASGSSEGFTFVNNYFVDNKYCIKSNGVSRVTLGSNQFSCNGYTIANNVAITQGTNDARWFIGVNQYLNYSTNIIEAGIAHVNFRNVNINDAGVIFPQAGSCGVYSGAGYPEGVVTANQGSIYLRNNGGSGYHVYIKNSGTGNTGWVSLTGGLVNYSNSTRPSASTFPIGFVMYNTDDNAPNYSDGTNWRDAMGTIT